MKIRDALSRFKHNLPFNGDWIYPTPTPHSLKQTVDLAEIYSDPAKIIQVLPQNIPEKAYDVLLGEADRLAQQAAKRADHVREKAKVLLGTSSFVGAVVLGLISFFAQHLSSLPQWTVYVVLVLLSLMLLQFGISLLRSMEAMTREEVLELSVEDLAETLKNGDDFEKFQWRLAASRFAVANRNHKYISEKVNKLILGQEGFRYGIVYLLFLVLTLVSTTSLSNGQRTRNEAGKLTLKELHAELGKVAGNIQNQVDDLKTTSSHNLLSIQKELEELSERVDDLAKITKRPSNSKSE